MSRKVKSAQKACVGEGQRGGRNNGGIFVIGVQTFRALVYDDCDIFAMAQ